MTNIWQILSNTAILYSVLSKGGISAIVYHGVKLCTTVFNIPAFDSLLLPSLSGLGKLPSAKIFSFEDTGTMCFSNENLKL